MNMFKIGEQYYFKANSGVTLQLIESCLDKKLGMRMGSFAEQYSKRIFRDLFLYARDLKREYYDYYEQEYESFEQFLYHKELLDLKILKIFELSPDDTILELQPELANYNIINFLSYEESGINTINQVFEEISL